jgi:uncharacterized protein
MKRFFLDTSALVKIYHHEDGTEYCMDLYKGPSHLMISQLACVEFQSAVFRMYRENELNKNALRAVLEKFTSDCDDRYEILHIASLIFDEACKLLSRYGESYGLRTLDSLQLAFFINYSEINDDTFLCADKKLSSVCKQEGVNVVFVK